MLSATSSIFTVTSSEITGSPAIPGPPSTSNTAAQTYNGCGLDPLPDFTYTGYQPPCTVTSNGVAEIIYPIVPVSASTSFFGTSYLGAATGVSIYLGPPTSTKSTVSSASSTSINTAFATGVYAQALQCPTPVTPSTTKMTVGGATTIFSTVGCAASSDSSTNSGGICHTSGYTTFSVSGTSSVCCPGGWATTPMNSELFCFTSIGQANKREVVNARQVSTETLESAPNTILEYVGLAFTSAGIVTGEAAVETGSSSSRRNLFSSTPTMTTGSAASANPTKSSCVKLEMGAWRVGGVALLMTLLSLVG